MFLSTILASLHFLHTAAHWLIWMPQNTMNSCVRSDNQSGLKGVSRVYKRNWWESRITLNGKTIRLGQFKTAEEAHAAYCEAATRLHGEFARFA